MAIKELIRSSMNFLHLDLTKNLEYDRLTNAVMKKVIHKNSNCIDIGSHKGEILNIMLKVAPEGKHYAFEPVPSFYEKLKSHFSGRATIYPYALSDKKGETTFQYVKNAPAYSGIKKRKYDIDSPEIEEIKVAMQKLDDVIPECQKIDFIKLDVEGGEFGVLKGGRNLIIRNKPIIIFEFGLGASDYYGTKPADLFHFITNELNLNISLLKSYLKNDICLSQDRFEEFYNSNSEYYFVAHPSMSYYSKRAT